MSLCRSKKIKEKFSYLSFFLSIVEMLGRREKVNLFYNFIICISLIIRISDSVFSHYLYVGNCSKSFVIKIDTFYIDLLINLISKQFKLYGEKRDFSDL